VAAHAFACVHKVFEICENYAGRPWRWFFQPELERLEIIPHLRWNNAQSGFGYLELGEDRTTNGGVPFALNFDSVAHEVGHLVLLSAIGIPRVPSQARDFYAYHEAVADFVSMIGLLQFDTAMDRILRRTRGNLLLSNELDRFAELSNETQIRRFGNSLRVQDVGNEVHDRSRPFSGALFDALIEIYQLMLWERGVADLDPRDYGYLRQELSSVDIDELLSTGDQDYELRHLSCKAALSDARDLIGEMLVRSWTYIEPDGLSFGVARDALLLAASRGRAAPYVDLVADNFAWRGFT
jgi:hypothetical protein